jgi:hypothetical protein
MIVLNIVQLQQFAKLVMMVSTSIGKVLVVVVYVHHAVFSSVQNVAHKTPVHNVRMATLGIPPLLLQVVKAAQYPIV